MKETVAERVWEVAEPLVTDEGLEIVDIEHRRESRGWVLRLFVDREGGVSLDDLTRVSRQLGDLLDAHDLVPGAYTLELSSPGINRQSGSKAITTSYSYNCSRAVGNCNRSSRDS